MKRPGVLRLTVYGTVLILFTVLFTVVNYPTERLSVYVSEWIVSATDGAVTTGDARIRLPFALVVSDITLREGVARPLNLGEAVIRPGILAFLSGKKAADVRLSNPWFRLRSRVVSSADSLDLAVRDAEIDLGELPEDLFPVPLELSGKVRLSLDLVTEALSRETFSGNIRLSSGPIVITGDLLQTLGLSPFNITGVSAVASVKDNVASLGENSVEGDLSAVANGEIRLLPADPAASRLNLDVKLTPGPDKKEKMGPIFALMGTRIRADGNINIRVRGTIKRPVVTM